MNTFKVIVLSSVLTFFLGMYGWFGSEQISTDSTATYTEALTMDKCGGSKTTKATTQEDSKGATNVAKCGNATVKGKCGKGKCGKGKCGNGKCGKGKCGKGKCGKGKCGKADVKAKCGKGKCGKGKCGKGKCGKSETKAKCGK